MSIINTDRDLERLCIEIRVRNLSSQDLTQIADALPTPELCMAALRRMAGPERTVEPYDDKDLPGTFERARKFGMVVRLLLAWEKVPEQRLGQLLINGTGHHCDTARCDTSSQIYYSGDADLASLMESFVARYTASEEK